MSIISKLFKVKDDSRVQQYETINNHLKNLNKTIEQAVNNKEDIEDFILILKEIQKENDTEGNVLKNYTRRKNAINNQINLAIEKYTKRIKELDTTNT